MEITVAQTISDETRKHLNNGGKLFGQCVTAVGWVGGTIPEMTEDEGIVELPLSDVSNPGMAIGCALAGNRPIYVIRYQGFLWYNAASLINYAAKSKEMWNTHCPIFIRAIAMEGGVGPVATSSEHSMVMRKPGLPVFAPMTPNEWLQTWEYFLAHDDPVFCSEHRKSFGICSEELSNPIQFSSPDITIFAISAGRLSAKEASEKLYKRKNIRCNIIPIVQLKPFSIIEKYIDELKKTNLGLVVDSDNEICGASRSFAYELMLKTGYPVYALGIADKTAGFAPHLDNGTPTTQDVYNKVLEIIAIANK